MIRAFQWDLGRQVERLDWLVAQLPRYADWGYQELYLHLEDAVEFPSLPGVARKDAYSRRQFGRLVDAASQAGIGVVPIVNLLGHTQYLIKVPALRDLNELRAPDGSPLAHGQVCPLHPRMMEVADLLLRDMAPFCTAGKVHAGLDESFSLGRHPLSRAEVAEVGLAAHFGRYVGRLHGLAAGLRLRLGLWADMLALLPAAIDHLPPGTIAYDWSYYPFTRKPRIELRNFAEYDLAPALRARGVEYWGCPMNGSFRHEPMPVFGERLANLRDWWRRCSQVRASGYLVTSWEPNRLALPLTTVVDAAAAGLWLEPGLDDDTGMLAAGFTRAGAGDRGRELARAALACDRHAFVGNARWEINDRWDVSTTRRGVTRFEAERSFFTRLSRHEPALPPAFRASVQFRRYLAERDVFVRTAAAAIFALRRLAARHGAADARVTRGLSRLHGHCGEFAHLLRDGARRARELWALTRDPRVRGPNERILAQDVVRLAALRQWTAAALRDPRLLATASPVCGAWQLRFDVLLDRPALQKVVVEARTAAGTWEVLRGRVAIEFRAEAARPLARLRREFSVPVPGPETLLRVAVRGIGQVAIAGVELTDGVTTLVPRGWRAARRARIGTAAPASGFPDLDWGRNTGAVLLAFGRKKEAAPKGPPP